MKLHKIATLSAVLALIISGCGAKPKPAKEPVIDSTLPKVELTKSGIIVDMDSVAFEWKFIEDPRVEGIYIYKHAIDQNATDFEYLDTVDNRFSTHYVDTTIKPDSKYRYYFKSFSSSAESVQSAVANVQTLPELDSVSWIHNIDGMPRSAKIIWRPHTNQIVKGYRIERKTLEEDQWKELAVINGRLCAEFIDKGLKDNYVYKYRIRALTYNNIVSKPSEQVKVLTKALPNEITGIIASKDLPKKIFITWKASKAQDLSHYNLYRSKEAEDGYSLIAKLKRTEYTDEIEGDGERYFYRVAAVDTDGLESHSHNHSILGSTLIKPIAPSVSEARLVGNTIKLSWSATDKRIESYILTKRYKKGFFDEMSENFKGIKSKEYIDKNIQPNTSYFYRVYGVDSNGIVSEPSIEVEVKSPDVALAPVPVSSKREEAVAAPKVIQESPQRQQVIIPTQDFKINEL